MKLNEYLSTFALTALLLAGCFLGASPNDAAYWFLEYSTEFVAYDEETRNLDEAGNYYKMTMLKDTNTILTTRFNAHNYYFWFVTFTVNGNIVL